MNNLLQRIMWEAFEAKDVYCANEEACFSAKAETLVDRLDDAVKNARVKCLGQGVFSRLRVPGRPAGTKGNLKRSGRH
jgi:hypothetical protein